MQTVYISASAQQQIEYLHRSYPNKEWSGICVYKSLTPQYSILESDLEVVYIAPRDLGSAAFTSSEGIGKEAMLDILENFDMTECRTGYIHSHHTMDTFFSGTDMHELNEMAINHFDFFLSVIVNVKNKHNAKIAIKCEQVINSHYKINGQLVTETKKETGIKIFDLKVKIKPVDINLWKLFKQQLTILQQETVAKEAAKTTILYNKQANLYTKATKQLPLQKDNNSFLSFIDYSSELEDNLEFNNDFEEDAYILFEAVENKEDTTENLFKEFVEFNPIPINQKIEWVKLLLGYLREYKIAFAPKGKHLQRLNILEIKIAEL